LTVDGAANSNALEWKLRAKDDLIAKD
jgi:hypothetical protein